MTEIERAIQSCRNQIRKYENRLSGADFHRGSTMNSIQLEKVKIAALQEKQEREMGCEHCRGWDKRCGANFCPMCGRKLGESNG